MKLEKYVTVSGDM